MDSLDNKDIFLKLLLYQDKSGYLYTISNFTYLYVCPTI